MAENETVSTNETLKTLKTRIALRSDTAASWEANKDKVLLKGEVGIEFDSNAADPKQAVKIKVGDNSKKWSELPYINYDGGRIYTYVGTEGETPASVLAKNKDTKMNGDIAIVQIPFGNGKMSYTAYVFHKDEQHSAWEAMDGNYSTENVYFDSDIITTSKIGVHSPDSTGKKIIPVKGLNIKEALETLLVEETIGTTTPPSFVKCEARLLIGNSAGGSALPKPFYLETGVYPRVRLNWLWNPGHYQYGYAKNPDGTAVPGDKNGKPGTEKWKDIGQGLGNKPESKLCGYTYGGKTVFNSTEEADLQLVKEGGENVTFQYKTTNGACPITNLGRCWPQAFYEPTILTKTETLFKWYEPAFYTFRYSAEDKITKFEDFDIDSVPGKIIGADACAKSAPRRVDASGPWYQFIIALPTSYKKTNLEATGGALPLTVKREGPISYALSATTVNYYVWHVDLVQPYDQTNVTLKWS